MATTPQSGQKQTIIPSQKMYIDVSGRGGLAPRWYGDEGDTIEQHPEFRHLGKSDLQTAFVGESTATDMASGSWNPSRRFGFMCPINISFTSLTESDAGFAFTNQWRATIYDPSVSSLYVAENGPLIWGSGSSGSYTDFKTIVGGTIGGTNVKVTDLEIYQVNGVRQIMFSYTNDTGGGNIGIFQPNSNGTTVTNNNTWLQGTCTSGFYLGAQNDHFMVASDNGFLYVGDGNAVHKIDGTAATGGAAGTATQNVLVAPPSFTFMDGVDFKGSMWFAIQDTPVAFADTSSYSSGTCGVYVWDRQTTIVSMTDFIPVKGMKSIRKIYVTQSGKVRIIGMSSKRTIQIREFDGSVFDTIDESAMVSWPTYRDSLTVAGNLVYWLGQDSRIYAHGPVVPGESDRLFIMGDATAVTQASFTTGAILFFENNSSVTVSKTGVYFSIKDSSPTVYNKLWFPNGVGGSPGQDNVFTLVKYFPQFVKVNYVRIYHHVGSASTSSIQQGTFKIYFNQDTINPIQFIITKQDVGKGYRYCPLNQGAKNAVFAIQAAFHWDASTVLADGTDWMPRLLEVDYTPIEKLM